MRRPCLHAVLPPAAVLAAVLAASPAFAHPSLYFDDAGLAELEQRAASTTDSGLGWSFAEAFESIKDAVNKGYRYSAMPVGNNWVLEVVGAPPGTP